MRAIASIGALAALAVCGGCSSDDEPTPAAEVYPGIALEVTVTDDALTLDVTAGGEDVVVLDPTNPVTVDEDGDTTRWVWERPPRSGGDAGAEGDSRPGRLVAAGSTASLTGRPDDTPAPDGPWEACTILASPDEAWETGGSDPEQRRVPPLADGSEGVELCAGVDEEGR